MSIKLTTFQKVQKVKIALKIIHNSIENGVPYSISSKKYEKNRRFIYDVNRRWIKKNSAGVPAELIVEFKKLFKPKA